MSEHHDDGMTTSDGTRAGMRATHIVEPARMKHLRTALQLVGVIFIFGIYALTIVWPSGWAWHKGHTPHYLQMILGVYATLGIFLLIASRKPLAHLSLIWFTVWSSVAHGGVMAAQALANPERIATPLGRCRGAIPCCCPPRLSNPARRGRRD